MNWLKKVFFHSSKKYLIALAIATLLTIVYLLLRSFSIKMYYIDAFSIAGAVTFFVGCFSLLSYFGAFDTFGYSFSSRRGRNFNKYEDMYDYIQKKQEKRKNVDFPFIPYMVIGVLFMLIAVIISLI